MILLITGEYGVGKDLAADTIAEYYGDGAQKIKSYTTRVPRYPDEDTHIFVDRNSSEFPNEHVLAWVEINEDYYWTEWQQFNPNKLNIYVIDKEGARQVMEKVDKSQVILFEIIRPEWMRNVPRQRLTRDVPECEGSVHPDYRCLNTLTKEKFKEDIIEGIELFYTPNKI